VVAGTVVVVVGVAVVGVVGVGVVGAVAVVVGVRIMKCKLIRGHMGHLLLVGEEHHSGIFVPGRRTLTGARRRNGELRAMSARMLLDYLGVVPSILKEPYDSLELESDRGIFDPLTPVDLSQHASRIFGHVSLSVPILMGACALESKQWKKEKL